MHPNSLCFIICSIFLVPSMMSRSILFHKVCSSYHFYGMGADWHQLNYMYSCGVHSFLSWLYIATVPRHRPFWRCSFNHMQEKFQIFMGNWKSISNVGNKASVVLRLILRMFDSQPAALVIATDRMAGGLVFVQIYVNATVNGQGRTVIHVCLHNYTEIVALT